jgi:hypothetical protein
LTLCLAPATGARLLRGSWALWHSSYTHSKWAPQGGLSGAGPAGARPLTGQGGWGAPPARLSGRPQTGTVWQSTRLAADSAGLLPCLGGNSEKRSKSCHWATRLTGPLRVSTPRLPKASECLTPGPTRDPASRLASWPSAPRARLALTTLWPGPAGPATAFRSGTLCPPGSAHQIPAGRPPPARRVDALPAIKHTVPAWLRPSDPGRRTAPGPARLGE